MDNFKIGWSPIGDGAYGQVFKAT